jgi:hypothetical protein
MQFITYTPEWTDAVRRFNRRLLAGGLEPELIYPEEPKAEFPTESSSPIHQEFFLAVEGSEVRGGYFLTYETWRINQHEQEVCNYRLPISESLVNSSYRGLGGKLVRDAKERNPFLYCLGMGNVRRSLPKLLKAENWSMEITPFYFRCVNLSRILRNLTYLRNNVGWRLAMDLADWKVSALLLKNCDKLRSSEPAVTVTVEIAEDFGHWTDRIWEQTLVAYPVLAVRDQVSLRIRYPAESPRFLRLVASVRSEVVGWAILLDTAMKAHRHFGDLRVGTIVDGLVVPGMEQSVVYAATRTLEERGVDLIVSNQSHRKWQSALQRCGFFRGPSNRILAVSPELAAHLNPLESQLNCSHFTRGGAAGPIHL